MAEFVTISIPKHASSQVKGGHTSGEIELIQAGDQSRTQSMPVRRLGAGHDSGDGGMTRYPILDIRLTGADQ